ncbi:Transmembrane and coiled-coil domain-containing protein 4, variant 2 [Chamberlinius hualienensis]
MEEEEIHTQVVSDAEEEEEEEIVQEQLLKVIEEMESEEAVVKRIPLNELLTDVGRFSFCSLCASLLAQLYSQNYRDFCLSYMKNLVQHLDLPDKVLCTMEAFLDDEAPDSLATLVPIILSEQQDTGAILQELIYSSIKNGVYDARSRVLVHSVASFLRVKESTIEDYERGALHCLTDQITDVSEEQKKASEKAAKKKKIRRRVLITAASIGGGVLIGLTGGLAVPLLATGAAAIIGGAGAAVIGSIAGTAVIGSLFGLAGAGLTGMKMKKRVGEVEEFAFEELTEGKELNLTIAISGWLADDSPSAFRQPWENLFLSKEQYCLRYESKYLRDLGTALEQLATMALAMVTSEALKTTALAALLAPIAAPAAIIQLTSIIDNPWGVCVKRSAEVGSMLAHVLLSRQQGMRPITLIGYSFGARVIFYCLKEMQKQKRGKFLINLRMCIEKWHRRHKLTHGKKCIKETHNS